MMQVEFERLVGREVTSEQYKLIEELYMQSSLSKQDFAKQMKKVVNSLPRPRCSKTYTMAVTDKSGHYRTPERVLHSHGSGRAAGRLRSDRFAEGEGGSELLRDEVFRRLL